MDPLSQVFCLKWNNHQNNLLTVLDHLYQTEAFCDVTLACDNTSIKCHKMILSACSSYFQTLFMENTCEHPIVFLKDIKIGEVRAILDYMYKGEVNVAQEELPGLLKVAELLRVKGLVEGEGDKLLNSNYNKNGRPLVTTSMNEPPSSSSKVNGGNAAEYRDEQRRGSTSISERERERDNKESPNNAAAAAASAAAAVRPFMMNPQAGLPMPMFPIPGMFPNLLGARDGVNRGRGEADGGDSANERDGSPSPGSGNKRRKVASGSGGSSSSKESGLTHDQPLNMENIGRDRDEKLPLPHDMDKEGMMGVPPGLDKSGIANYVPSQRLEWKRYKQYTRNDIMSAIEEVRNGMSALQASRKYGVPSRTLYDKVKKMGITTGRQVQRKSLPNYPSQFPGLNMMNVNDMDDREDTNDSSLGTPGDEPRATMVPPTSLSTYMLNIMKGINPDHGKGSDNEISLTPMNLSTMLSTSSSSKHLPPPTESSLSPRSPRPHQRDLDDDTVDSTDPSVSRGRGRHSSGGSNEATAVSAASMADSLKSQFLARLNAASSGNGGGPSTSEQHAASSTTHSPPAAPATPTEENNLPPRKRKVSQEHQNLSSRPGGPNNGEGSPTGAHGGFNGTHDPEKEESDSVDCRN